LSAPVPEQSKACQFFILTDDEIEDKEPYADSGCRDDGMINVKFYRNKIKLRGLEKEHCMKIENLIRTWNRHRSVRWVKVKGWTPWLFPTHSSSIINPNAVALTYAEARIFSEDKDILERVLKVSGKMLEIFGFWCNFKLETKSSLVSFRRADGWRIRFRELNSNKFLQSRITRVLKFWSCIRLQRWQVPFIKHLMFEIYVFDHLTDLRQQVGSWIQTVRNKHKKELARLYEKAWNIKENPETLSEFANSPPFAKVRRFLPFWSEAVETKCNSWRAKKQREKLPPPLAPEAPTVQRDLWHRKSTNEKTDLNTNGSGNNRGSNEKQRPFDEAHLPSVGNLKPSQVEKRVQRPENILHEPRVLRFKLPARSDVQRQSLEHNRYNDMRRRNETLRNTIRELQNRLHHSERAKLEIKGQLDHYYRETLVLKQHQCVLQNDITMLRNDLSSRGDLQLACTQELDHLKQERNHLYSELAKIRAETQEKYSVPRLEDNIELLAVCAGVQFDGDAVKNPNARGSVVDDHIM